MKYLTSNFLFFINLSSLYNLSHNQRKTFKDFCIISVLIFTTSSKQPEKWSTEYYAKECFSIFYTTHLKPPSFYYYIYVDEEICRKFFLIEKQQKIVKIYAVSSSTIDMFMNSSVVFNKLCTREKINDTVRVYE